MHEPKIIVLTPVKNEEWILQQFLTITSLFADGIIVTDQKSTDESRTICGYFPKVHLINNDSDEFNEAERQKLLIQTARELYPNNKRILLALDADELFSYNSLDCSSTWTKIRSLETGTSLYFEKPDILPGIKKCIRYLDNYFAIGYIDDSAAHSAKPIHSKRIPEGLNKVIIDNIKILHFAHSRKNVQSSKLRYYSVVENINNINPVYLRRSMYICNYDESKFYSGRMFEDIPAEWIDGWEQKGIDLKNFYDPSISWYDLEVLHFFKKFGSRRFHFDDIWCFDWESCRQAAIKMKKDVPAETIKYPGFVKQVIAKTIDKIYSLYKRFKKR